MQESKKPIIQSIRDYVMLNPDVDDRKINIDYLGNGMEYSIDPIGADPVYNCLCSGLSAGPSNTSHRNFSGLSANRL